MTPDKNDSAARETYEAYRKGEINAAQVEQRAQEWYSAHRGASSKPPAKS